MACQTQKSWVGTGNTLLMLGVWVRICNFSFRFGGNSKLLLQVGWEVSLNARGLGRNLQLQSQVWWEFIASTSGRVGSLYYAVN